MTLCSLRWTIIILLLTSAREAGLVEKLRQAKWAPQCQLLRRVVHRFLVGHLQPYRYRKWEQAFRHFPSDWTMILCLLNMIIEKGFIFLYIFYYVLQKHQFVIDWKYKYPNRLANRTGPSSQMFWKAPSQVVNWGDTSPSLGLPNANPELFPQ